MGEVFQPRANILIEVIKARLAAKAGEPGYWQVRAYPPLSGKEQAVRVAVWEPEGVDLSLFKHPTNACLVLAPGRDCLVDPQLDGLDRSQAWALVQGYRDFFENNDTPKRQAWEKYQSQWAIKIGQLSGDPGRKDELKRYSQSMGAMIGEVAPAQSRQHGTHVAGIVVDGNPFVDVVAIRDAYTAALPPQLDAQAWKDRYKRIAVFLKQHHVRIVNMSWGRSQAEISAEHATAIRQHMQALMAALPNILFVAAAGNDDHAVNKSGFLPAGLDAPNLLSVGAVDQDGQVTYFSNLGAAL